jgi:hypothetical protein
MHSSPGLILITKAIKTRDCYLKYLDDYVCDNPAYLSKCCYEHLKDLVIYTQYLFLYYTYWKIWKFVKYNPNLPLSKKKEEKNSFFNGPKVIFSKVKVPNLFLHLERAFSRALPGGRLRNKNVWPSNGQVNYLCAILASCRIWNSELLFSFSLANETNSSANSKISFRGQCEKCLFLRFCYPTANKFSFLVFTVFVIFILVGINHYTKKTVLTLGRSKRMLTMTEGNPPFIISDIDESNWLSKLNLDKDVFGIAGPIPVGHLIQASKVVSKPTIQPIVNNCREDSLSNAKT